MIPVNNFGTKLSTFAGANMNSLWATIVLGEWFANYERTPNGLDRRNVSISKRWNRCCAKV